MAFPLRGGQTVVRQHRPAVGFVDIDVVASHVDHRLDGERHAGHDEHPRAPFAEVLHVGFFMELDAAAVAAQVAHDAVPVLLGMFLYGGAHVAQAGPGLGHPDADVAAFARHLYQAAHLGADVSDEEHARGVREVAVVDGRHVHVDDVTVLQHFLRAGDAVADDFVDAGADALGEAFVEEGRGDGVVVRGEAVDQVVDVGRCHALAYVRGHVVQQRRVDAGAGADAFYLLGCAQQVALREADAFFLVMLDFVFYFVRIPFGGESGLMDELLHVSVLFLMLQSYALARKNVPIRAEISS